MRPWAHQIQVDDIESPALVRPVLACAVTLLGIALAAYITAIAVHAPPDWFDLHVYNQAGLIARHSPSTLYTWQVNPQVRFTYTPFAAVIFAVGSLLPWQVLSWLMTVASVLAVPLTAWLTFGALGWRGRSQAAAALALGAVALWTEPVQRALHLGQIELVLMLLVVWDLGQPDRRWWKGAGIGVAAGIKLVPLIFIPYLVLAGKLRQAAAAAVALAVTIVIGLVCLPQESDKWWLTGYFLSPGKVGTVGGTLNQSGLAMLTRLAGTELAAAPVWRAAAVSVAVLGLAAAALLHRSGRPVQGWATCALTSLLISPISWDHHWVWLLPALAVLAGLAVRARGAARWGYWALAGTVAIIFSDAGATGLLGFYPAAAEIRDAHLHNAYHLHGVQLISWNLFVLTGLGLFALALCAAWHAWHDIRSREGRAAQPTELRRQSSPAAR